MISDAFLGVVLVARQTSSQAQVVFQYPRTTEIEASTVFGLGGSEFGKFALPTQWLMNRKLDFEIEQCGPSIAARTCPTGSSRSQWDHLRFVSFPCDCSPPDDREPTSDLPAQVTAFNIVFVFDARELSESDAELFWQALATISRAVIAEEHRCSYLTRQVSLMLQGSEPASVNLCQILTRAYHGLRSPNQGVSLYVNESILTHVGVIPFGQAPTPPSGHQSLLLTCNPDSLQSLLPVDSASNARRLIDAADPSKTIKDHMIELGLPISTIQRISQHLVYWKKARIVHPLNKRLVLGLSPNGAWAQAGVSPSAETLNEFRTKFGLKSSENAFSQILFAFSNGKRLSDVKDILTEDIPQLHNKFSELCVFLLAKGVLAYSGQFFRYFPPLTGSRAAPGGPGGKRFGGFSAIQRPKFQNQLPHEIRSQFSPLEFDIIHERLRSNAVGSELMIKLIANYVKKHIDLLTARVELNEQNRCTNDDFHKYTEALTGGYLDSLLVQYACDL